MNDEGLLTTDPSLVTQRPNDDRGTAGVLRNDQNNPMLQSGNGMLTTFINSEDMRTVADSALNENRQLKEQLAQVCSYLSSWKPRIEELEVIKKSNSMLKDQVVTVHNKAKKKVEDQREVIIQLQRENDVLKKQITESQRRGSPDMSRQGSPDLSPASPESYRGPVLEEVKVHMRAVELILREELSSVKQEDREKNILEKLMDHIKKAEEILSTEDVAMYQGPSESLTKKRLDVEPQQARSPSPSDKKTPPSPLSPTGQRAYDQSMENVLGQLQALRQQVTETESALNKERMRSEALDKQLKETQSALNTLRGTRESHVAEAMERQRKEDDMKHQHEMDKMMAKLDELTLLAAEKHQKHALDEEPRYHSASNELKQQVTSLVAELQNKDRCINDEKAVVQQLQQVNAQLQRKVSMYHEELAKARREAQSYIDTIHTELKRKETLYQSERQKALHEKLQHDKCKEELGTAQAKVSQFIKDRNKYQEKEDRYLAEILSAEEAIEAKERDKLKYEQMATKIKSELHIWKTQNEVCKSDFQAERKAREQMHTEKLALQGKIDSLMRENKKIEDELQHFHRQQLHAGGNPYGPAGYERRYDRREEEMYGMRQHVYNPAGDDEAGNIDPPMFHAPYQQAELRQPQQVTTDNWCPKCQQTFPDYDTLNIHLADCID